MTWSTGKLQRRRAMLGQFVHDVTLRHDAGEAPLGTADHQRADVVLGQKFRRRRKVRRRVRW